MSEEMEWGYMLECRLVRAVLWGKGNGGGKCECQVFVGREEGEEWTHRTR